ncbi:hypothetical protein ACFQU9_35390 [Actinomadura namibiensis]|uniref:Nitrous oxide reductase n=1 Tax=Actinomadura namibiensis TaxID=182080 RepID=A0A7W3QS80_ACTNM|nr:hypothetical protein [Actinomadura namibiensis]MBA8957565.1 nitrous oxide reductase [Actinomadura namibiensis]
MSDRPGARLSRRALLTAAATTGAAATGTAVGGALLADGDTPPSTTRAPSPTEPFHGKHQPGIATPQQHHASSRPSTWRPSTR